uniref:Uncharacterized protein n=1 Tax=Nelumbo nucifera TaxID=4432 RepID=A0A822YDW5_NELNU|nr:TPA_asm: hypothetical protein HUJ06_031169 [Nelumbo nucifera]
MAALLIVRSFHTKSTRVLFSRSASKVRFCLSCQGREPSGSSDPKSNREEKQRENKHLFSRLHGGIERLGRGLKDNLSPKQKGDWKDVTLMSFSFAVYIYISQKIVCAYCAWMSMLKQPW